MGNNAERMLVDDDDMDTGVWLESIQQGDEESEYDLETKENELSIRMVDDEIVKKVRNKSVLDFEDNGIYCVEVACIKDIEDILESIIGDIVCRGVNYNVTDEMVGKAVHMHDDWQGQVVGGHHDQLQCLHSGGGELSSSLVEGEQQHQHERAHAVNNQAGDDEHHEEVTQAEEEGHGDHSDGPGCGGDGERDDQQHG